MLFLNFKFLNLKKFIFFIFVCKLKFLFCRRPRWCSFGRRSGRGAWRGRRRRRPGRRRRGRWRWRGRRRRWRRGLQWLLYFVFCWICRSWKEKKFWFSCFQSNNLQIRVRLLSFACRVPTWTQTRTTFLWPTLKTCSERARMTTYWPNGRRCCRHVSTTTSILSSSSFIFIFKCLFLPRSLAQLWSDVCSDMKPLHISLNTAH